jgi:hypothetical protein
MTRAALVAGVFVLAALVALAAIGFSALTPLLVTGLVLVVLVAGGNLLGARTPPRAPVPRRRAPEQDPGSAPGPGAPGAGGTPGRDPGPGEDPS